MNEQDKFDEAETIGRQLFTAICENKIPGCKIHRFSKNKYSSWDVSYSIEDELFIGEIKVRNYNSNEFNSWYMEQHKLDALLKLQTQYNFYTNLMYINIYSNNRYSIFNVNELEKQTPRTKYLPQTTYGKQTLIPTKIYECGIKEIIYNGKIN